MIEKMELTELSKYQLDFILFKNEVIKLLNKHEEKQKKKESEDKNTYEDISKFQAEQMHRFSQRITELSSTRYVEQEKLDKIESIAQKQVTLTENVSINTIRLATCQKELANAIYKYDKIFLDNLTVPGLVGSYCKYKNLREFIQFAQDNILNLSQSKCKDQAALQVYKESIETMLKQFSLKFDSILKQTFGYTKEAFAECSQNNKNAVQEIYDKMDSVRLENSKYAVALKSQNEEFSKDLEAIRGVKVDLFNKMSNTMTAIDSRNKEFSDKYDLMKKTFETITVELKKHTGLIEGLNQTINELKGGYTNRNRSNPNTNRERKGDKEKEKDKDTVKDKDKEASNKYQDKLTDEKLRIKVIEIINDYFISNAHGKEPNNKKMMVDFKNMNLEVESNLKKYIKGEITSAEFSPNQRKRGSSLVKVDRKSNQCSPKVNEDQHNPNAKNDNIPNLNLEEEKEHDKHNDKASDSNSDSESSTPMNESIKKIDTLKPTTSNNKVPEQEQEQEKHPKENKGQLKYQSKKPNQVADKNKSSSTNYTSTTININNNNNNSTNNNKKKKLSIAISSKEEFIPKIKSTDTLQNDDQDKAYSNILNWKINEKMKNKIQTKDKDKAKAKTERGKETSSEAKKESNHEHPKRGLSTTTKDKSKDYMSRYNNYYNSSKDNIESKNDMITIKEYEYNQEEDIKRFKCKSKDNNIKTSILKDPELFINPSNASITNNNNTSKQKREISQESNMVNLHYPQIESCSTPHYFSPSKSESKFFFNKNYNIKKPKCQSAKREDDNANDNNYEGGNLFENAQIKSSFKLSKDQIEKKLIEIEYFTKKKFDELVGELQKYIPLNFKSHTRYCRNDIDESVENQRRNKTPNEIEYENDLRHAKISIVTSEVIEKANDNGAFRSLFPRKSPRYQGGDKKSSSSFRKLQQGAKDKEKEKEKKATSNNNKTQLFGGNNNGYSTNYPSSSGNNLKEMNFSDGSSYVALNKLFTNIPKSSVNANATLEEKNGGGFISS